MNKVEDFLRKNKLRILVNKVEDFLHKNKLRILVNKVEDFLRKNKLRIQENLILMDFSTNSRKLNSLNLYKLLN